MKDPELQEIFTDRAHQEVVDLLETSRPAAPPLDPHFRSYLRAKLMTEARRTLGPQAARPWFSFLRPGALAPAMAAVAAGFIVVLGVEVYLHNQPTGSSVAYNINQLDRKTNVATTEPIKIPFSGPVDKNAIEASIQIEPATAVSKQWEGNTLVLVPNHQLAANTTYTVSFKPLATTPTPNPSKPSITTKPSVAPTPVVVHFTTTPAPVPPAVPPSFNSSNVKWGSDSRLAEAGTILNATWTPAGQLLVTVPAGPAGPSASTGATPTGLPAAKASTDIWLMSALGTRLRLLAPGATLPAAAPTGGLFASWSNSGNQSSLQIRDLQGNLVSTAASVAGVPDRAAVWVGNDRVAYVDHGVLRIVGLHAPVNAATFKVDHGSLAGSVDGQLLAVESTAGSLVLDVASGDTRTKLPNGATGFAWSVNGDLAFTVPRDNGTDLYLLTKGTFAPIATSPSGQTWSDLNWGPDAASILLASKPTGSSASVSNLALINRDGSSLKTFGSVLQEYSLPQWSPAGDLVLFTRRDDGTGGKAFWTATATASAGDAEEQQALAEVDSFMQARIRGDGNAAQAEMDDTARAAYQGGGATLLSGSGSQFDRYYIVTVQRLTTNSTRFLVGVRVFNAKSGVETSFFEEQLTLLRQGQKYVIHGAKASALSPIGRGPTVVSVQVVQSTAGAQVRIRFDADLNPTSVSDSTITVRDAQGNDVSEHITFDADNHLATVAVNPPAGTYQLVVTTGVTDINGVALAQAYDAPLVINR